MLEATVEREMLRDEPEVYRAVKRVDRSIDIQRSIKLAVPHTRLYHLANLGSTVSEEAAMKFAQKLRLELRLG